jgi:hypothetical protein
VRLFVTVIVGVVVVLLVVGVHQRWRWMLPIAQWWERVRPRVAAYIRCSPATFIYLFVLAITTWVLHGSPDAVRHALLFEHSTNLKHLRNDPMTVLVTSAFWLTGLELWMWIVLFPLVLAPAERWLGTVRVIVVFGIGHVGATILTAAGLSFMIRHGLAPHRLRDVIDVGSSYGFCCVAATFSYRLPGVKRWLWAGTLLVGASALVAWNNNFTDYGHLAAVIIGLCLYPLTRAPSVRHRDHWPIWRPPELMVEAERERIEAHHRVVRGDAS